MMPGAYTALAIVAEGLACRRGGREVFAGLTFRLGAGHLLSVVGPNGVGKSSLLRVIAGLIAPEAGSLTIEGGAEGRRSLHYLGHADALKPAMRLRETLRFWSIVYEDGRVPPDDAIEAAADTAGLHHALELPVGVLSAGQRRRAALARLVLSPRPLWLLDEPTAALDGGGERLLGRLMQEHLLRGGLIVSATHGALPIAPHATLELGAGG